MRPVIVICAGIFALGVGAVLWLNISRHKEVQEVKPYLTYTRLMGAARDCDEYWSQHQSWPSSIAQLRAFRPDLNEWAVDMWGRDFVLVPFSVSTGYGQIISYGRDGKPGGSTEADRDIEVRFPTRVNTNWNAKVGQSLKKPYLRLQ
jgi:hypothetical protein